MMPARGTRGKAWLYGAIALVGLMGAGAGCATADKELAREEAVRRAEWKTLVARDRAAETAVLDWSAALERIRTHNGKVLAADLDVTRSVEALNQVKRSLIPTASFSAGYERFFDKNSNLGFEPFTFATSLFFDVPGLFSFRVRYEAAVLNVAHARLLRETVWRQQVIALYRAGLEGRELERRAGRLARRQEALASLAATAPDTAAGVRGALAQEQVDLARLRQEWLERTGEIVGLRGVPVVLADAGMPPLPYALASARPSPEELARLPLRLAALDLLALRARRLGITLQEWPEIQMSMSSPTVFETGGGGNYTWSPRELFLSVDSFWTLDTQGRHASDRRLLEKEMVYRHEVLEQEASATAARLRQALDGLARTDRRLGTVEQALASSGSSLRPELIRARQTLMADRCEWSLTLWFFDDAQWRSGS